MIDKLGNRMKVFYEDRSRTFLTRRSYTIIRIDGKAFHTYTRGLSVPFDSDLIEDMNETTIHLCKSIQGVKFGYVQSDEISLLITDFDEINTDMWFNGNTQKMVSVASSIATSKFNLLRILRSMDEREVLGLNVDSNFYRDWFKIAEFDARVFQIPSKVEVENYFIWRQKDCTKNSISSAAYALYSHKELEGVNSNEKQELIFQKGINWNNYTSREKRGGFIYRVEKTISPLDSPHVGLNKFGGGPGMDMNEPIKRNLWETIECPIFTENREFLSEKIPSDIQSRL